jgi:hypothetical protein
MRVYKYLKSICKMNAREFLDLQDAYQGVYQELDEVRGGGRIDPVSGFPNQGERARSPQDAGLKMSPIDRAKARANALEKREDPEAKKRANRIKSRFIKPTERGVSRAIDASNAARTAEKKRLMNNSYEYDTFDAILEHLVAEGYADTNENAIAIMANMSEEWREEILDEARVDDGKSKEDKRKIRTARAGRAGVNLPNSSLHTGDIDRRHAHRTTDDLNKDARDIRKGKLNLPQFQGTTGRERVAQVKKEKGIR